MFVFVILILPFMLRHGDTETCDRGVHLERALCRSSQQDDWEIGIRQAPEVRRLGVSCRRNNTSITRSCQHLYMRLLTQNPKQTNISVVLITRTLNSSVRTVFRRGLIRHGLTFDDSSLSRYKVHLNITSDLEGRLLSRMVVDLSLIHI